jgi:predicted PurR-regulated permease PerM
MSKAFPGPRILSSALPARTYNGRVATVTPAVSDPPEVEPKPAEKRRNLPAFLALMLALGVLLVLAVLIFSPFTAPIVVALIFTTMSQPYFAWILRRIGEKHRGLAAALTCSGITLVVILPLAWVAWSMVEQAPEGKKSLKEGAITATEWLEKRRWFQRLKEYETFRKYWERIQASVSSLKKREGEKPPPGAPAKPKQEAFPPAVEPGVKEPEGPPPGSGEGQKALPSLGLDVAGWTTAVLAAVLGNALEILVKFFLMLYILFYFLKDGPQILGSLNRAVPLEKKYQEKTVETFRKVTRSIIRGSFGTALIQGVVAAVAFLIVGIPAAFFGVLVAITSLIPPLGTALIMIPLTVFVFFKEHWGWGVYMVVVTAVIGSMDNVVRPFLVGQSLRMHPIWLLLSILGGMSVFGPLGLIYGPMVLVLLATFFALFISEEEAKAEGAEIEALAVAGARPPPPPPPVPPPSAAPRRGKPA